MVSTHTLIKCDGPACKERILGCTDAHSSNLTRELNALATAKRHGWVREWGGLALLDLCPSCSRALRPELDRGAA